jgi:hypothetical protein
MYWVFVSAAVVGIGGWLLVLSVWVWWMLQPVSLPTVDEPIPVLNANNEVAIGETLLMSLEVSKPQELAPTNAQRFIECQSGNLVTLTAAEVNLPVGEYEIISDTIVLPAKVSAGDTCRAVYIIGYQINPVRYEETQFVSEWFAVLPAVAP